MLPDSEKSDKPGSISNLFSELSSELPSDLFRSLLCEHKPHKWLPGHQKEVAAAYKRAEVIRGAPSHLPCCRERLSGYASQ